MENYLADPTDPTKLQSERTFSETKWKFLTAVQERLDDALENVEAKRIVQQKFEKLEHEHSDALKRVNQRITELKPEREGFFFSNINSKSLWQKLPRHVRAEHQLQLTERQIRQ